MCKSERNHSLARLTMDRVRTGDSGKAGPAASHEAAQLAPWRAQRGSPEPGRGQGEWGRFGEHSPCT